MGPGRVTGGHGSADFLVLRYVRFKECELQAYISVSFVSGAIYVFIAAAAPSKASLGATNGLTQLSGSIVRTVGPALVSSMYSLSIDTDHHYMGGWLVYYVIFALSLSAIWVGSLLPKHPWRDTD